MEALLIDTPQPTLLFSKWLTIASVGAIYGIITLIVVALEIGFLTANLKNAVSLGDNAALVVQGFVFITIIYGMLNAPLLMVTSIMGKTVKEAQSYSTPIMMVAIFPVMIITGLVSMN